MGRANERNNHPLGKISVFRLTLSVSIYRLVSPADCSRHSSSFPSRSYLKDGAERVLVGVVGVERSLVILHGHAHVSDAVPVELVLIAKRRHDTGCKV